MQNKSHKDMNEKIETLHIFEKDGKQYAGIFQKVLSKKIYINADDYCYGKMVKNLNSIESTYNDVYAIKEIQEARYNKTTNEIIIKLDDKIKGQRAKIIDWSDINCYIKSDELDEILKPFLNEENEECTGEEDFWNSRCSICLNKYDDCDCAKTGRR